MGNLGGVQKPQCSPINITQSPGGPAFYEWWVALITPHPHNDQWPKWNPHSILSRCLRPEHHPQDLCIRCKSSSCVLDFPPWPRWDCLPLSYFHAQTILWASSEMWCPIKGVSVLHVVAWTADAINSGDAMTPQLYRKVAPSLHTTWCQYPPQGSNWWYYNQQLALHCWIAECSAHPRTSQHWGPTVLVDREGVTLFVHTLFLLHCQLLKIRIIDLHEIRHQDEVEVLEYCKGYCMLALRSNPNKSACKHRVSPKRYSSFQTVNPDGLRHDKIFACSRLPYFDGAAG